MTTRVTRRAVLSAAAAAALPRTPVQAQPSKTDQFAGRVVEDAAATLRGALTYIGDRLGLFKTLAAAGPVTTDELARRTGLSARYLREWLGAMTAAEYVQYRPATREYLLPPEHAAVLADEESPAFLGGMLQFAAPAAAVSNRVAEAFRSGTGVAQSEYPPEIFEGIARWSAPSFKHRLVPRWIAAMPHVEAQLRAGGSALDVGCGWGLASIAIARAFPRARVFGSDSHAPSIDRARANARAAGLADRVTFEVRDGAATPPSRFDFISTFDVLHDAGNPAAIVTSIRKALASDGTYLASEPNLSPDVENNINTAGRMLYGATTLYCMSVSLAAGGAGVGADMNEELMRKLAAQCGFGRFRKLAEKDPVDARYELRV